MAANRPSRKARNLGCATDASMTSGIAWTSVTGRSLSMFHTSRRIVAATLGKLSVVFTTRFAPQNGDCEYGTYIIAPGSLPSATSRTLLTTPTISRTNALSGGKPNVICLPSGSSFGK